MTKNILHHIETKKSNQAMVNWKKIIINMHGKWDNFLAIQLNHENQHQTRPAVK